MELSNEEKNKYMKRLLKSRMRILVNNGFYGLLLMHMIYALDDWCETACTDGKRMYFSPKFLDELSDAELDFVMMHEILHVALQHCMRRGERNNHIFNVASDIVVNSNILLSEEMDIQAITLNKYGESMHKAPNDQEGYNYTAEQVYDMLNTYALSSKDNINSKNKALNMNGQNDSDTWDDHTRWGAETEDTRELRESWKARVLDAYKAMEMRKANNGKGDVPTCIERVIKELRTAQTDWRKILNEFIQEEIVDYSFSPPDRRFFESPFFLPDFNEKDDYAKDILLMIDTSASMSDEMIITAYSEVKGAIEQYNGKFSGWLGFFDSDIVEPRYFESVDEFRLIKPVGGGGTSFSSVFKYVRDKMMDRPPMCIIILTDGYGAFPKESAAMGIPVLWLLNNEIAAPPWGKVARIKIYEN